MEAIKCKPGVRNQEGCPHKDATKEAWRLCSWAQEWCMECKGKQIATFQDNVTSTLVALQELEITFVHSFIPGHEKHDPRLVKHIDNVRKALRGDG